MIPTANVCHKRGISPTTFYKWKSKFGGSEVSKACRPRTLEAEDARLKKLLADAILDNTSLKDTAGKMVAPGMRRQAVAQLCEHHEVREPRACKLVMADGARPSPLYAHSDCDFGFDDVVINTNAT